MSFLRQDFEQVYDENGQPKLQPEEVARFNSIVDHTPHFSREELQCPCCGKCEIQFGSAQKLENFRRYYGQPFTPNSAYRCQEHNDSLPDAKPDSAHTRGHAFDIPVTNSRERWKAVWSAIEAGFTRIGAGKTFIHVDDDPDKPDLVIWLY